MLNYLKERNLTLVTMNMTTEEKYIELSQG